MPFLAVLAAAPHVSRGINDALLQQRQTQRTKARIVGDVESAVTVKKRWVVAVELNAFLVGKEHWHTRAVFAVVEDLFHFIIVSFEAGNLNSAKHGRFLRRDVVLINRWRRIERSETVKDELVVVAPAKTTGRTQPRQNNFVLQFAIETINIGARRDIFQIGREYFASSSAGRLQRFRFLGKNIFPGFRCRIIKHDLAVWRLVICLNEKLAVDIIKHTITIVCDLTHNRCKRLFAF